MGFTATTVRPLAPDWEAAAAGHGWGRRRLRGPSGRGSSVNGARGAPAAQQPGRRVGSDHGIAVADRGLVSGAMVC